MAVRDSKGRFIKGSGGGGKRRGGASASVSVKDNGHSALMRRLEKAQRGRVTIGVHEEQGAQEDSEGTTVADVAAFHEFGLGVPRRSFIADWSDEEEEFNRHQLAKIAEAVVEGKFTATQGLDRFGLKCVADVQSRIKAGIDPELEEATVIQKGSSTPLIDKGTLWQSIRHKVT